VTEFGCDPFGGSPLPVARETNGLQVAPVQTGVVVGGQVENTEIPVAGTCNEAWEVVGSGVTNDEGLVGDTCLDSQSEHG